MGYTYAVIPVDQLVLHDEEAGVLGDCFRACVASIFELPCAEVPNFVEHHQWGRDSAFLLAVNIWTAQFGMRYVRLEWPESEKANVQKWIVPRGYHVIMGPSPRFPDTKHACVGWGKSVVHDPHPDRIGLGMGPRSYGLFLVDDPAAVYRMRMVHSR